MKRQMIVKLRQMNPRADRLEQNPKFLEPGKTAQTRTLVTSRPDNGDPGFPHRIPVHERRDINALLAGGSSDLLAGETAAGVGTAAHQG